MGKKTIPFKKFLYARLLKERLRWFDFENLRMLSYGD